MASARRLLGAWTVASQGRGRRRLFVVQVLVLSLFLTLFGRLWYLQVLSGESYQAQAAEQSVREVVVQPARGLVVDDMGRPLVADRTSWVVTVDRTLLHRMDSDEQERLLRRVARTVHEPYQDVVARTLLCGEPGSEQGTCWNGSPYQPVPVAEDVSQKVAVRILEQPEDFPGVLAQSQSVRAYPSPFGVNAAHVLGYLSPITEEELDEAKAEGDSSVHGASDVGRAGLEREYDKYLRGQPGYKKVAVDSMGRVLGNTGTVQATPGDTLVTSIDARVQSVVEKQLARTIKTARHTFDPVTGKNYVADAGAAVVLNAHNGRVVAMASQPTYDPKAWVGGISQKKLARFYSEKSRNPLLSRVTQGQFAPGSTWKPFMTSGAFTHGMGPETRLNCSSSFQVGNANFGNYRSEQFGYIDFKKAIEVSCNTFFYRVGYHFWQKSGGDPDDVDAKAPLVEMAKRFGFGSETGVDLPAESNGRIADRHWKRRYYEANKDYYCKLARDKGQSAYLHRLAREFCAEGDAYRAADAVNFAVGQGDTTVTPLQLAAAYGALSNGGTVWKPRLGKAVVDPQGKVVKRIEPQAKARVRLPKKVHSYVDDALQGVSREGTMHWRLLDFPLDKVNIRSKTGSAEVHNKQSTSWVASYTKDYVVVMMVSQGGTGSGTSGPAVRKIWENLYGVDGTAVHPAKSAIPGTTPPRQLPVFAKEGEILPPARKARRSHTRAHAAAATSGASTGGGS